MNHAQRNDAMSSSDHSNAEFVTKEADARRPIAEANDSAVRTGRHMTNPVESPTLPVEKPAKPNDMSPQAQCQTVGEIAGRPDLIHISEAAKIAGMSEAWLVRRMNEAGVCRIGAFLDYEEFKSVFRTQAQQRLRRHAVRPMVKPPTPKRSGPPNIKDGSVMSLVRELTKSGRERRQG